MSHHQTTNYKKANWAVIGIVLFLLLIAGALVFTTSSPAQKSQSGPAAVKSSLLLATEQSYDFGQISMAKGKVSRTFIIKNPTADPITVSKVYTSCMCTQAIITSGGDRKGPFGMPGHGGPTPTISQTIAPNSEASVEAIFDPAAHGPAGVGPIARDVFVETTDGGKLALEIKAQVTP